MTDDDDNNYNILKIFKTLKVEVNL